VGAVDQMEQMPITPPGQEGWTRHGKEYRAASSNGADGVVVPEKFLATTSAIRQPEESEIEHGS